MLGVSVDAEEYGQDPEDGGAAARSAAGAAHRAFDHLTRLSQDLLGRLTCGRIARPFAREMLAARASLDSAENAALTPPDDSHVTVEGFWALEAFTPANIEAVLARMRRRGWGRNILPGEHTNVVGWLRQTRMAGGSGNLDFQLARNEDRTYVAVGHAAVLPGFARAAVARVSAVTPSITTMTVFFVMKPQERGRLEVALRQVRPSTVRTKGRWATLIKPEFARREAVADIRRNWIAQIRTWMTHHAPGVFCEVDGASLPTCELLVGDNFPLYEPHGSEDQIITASSALDANRATWIFEEARDEGMMLAPHPCRAEGLERHGILACSRQTLEGGVDSLDRRAGPGRFAYATHRDFVESFVSWSLLELVAVYVQRINAARDQTARLFRSLFPQRVLKRLQRLTTILGDTAVVARELASLPETGRFHCIVGLDLVTRPSRPRELRRSLNDIVRERLVPATAGLSAASRDLNDFMAAQGNLTNARANFSLQVIVFAFALIGLAVSAVSATESGINLLKMWRGPAAEKSARNQVSGPQAVAPKPPPEAAEPDRKTQ